jgi:hypothetical protein
MAGGARAAEAPLIAVMRELEERRWRLEPVGRRRASNRTVRYRTRAALRLWRSMW